RRWSRRIELLHPLQSLLAQAHLVLFIDPIIVKNDYLSPDPATYIRQGQGIGSRACPFRRNPGVEQALVPCRSPLLCRSDHGRPMSASSQVSSQRAASHQMPDSHVRARITLEYNHEAVECTLLNVWNINSALVQSSGVSISCTRQ